MFLNRFYYFYVKQSREYHNLITLYSHCCNNLAMFIDYKHDFIIIYYLTLHWFLFHILSI